MALIPNALQERKFEKKHIEKQKKKYLETDSVQKYKSDIGYASKINLIDSFLNKYNTGGYILDVGANTAGEAEVLAHKGYNIVATDVNEIALSYSKIRSKKFRKKHPKYYAVDAHNMPFESNTFENVITFEMLHHLEKIKTALKEMYRVTMPGGKLFAYEPYAYNPYRRLAELRFYILGSIEKSFTVRGLTKLFEEAGFKVVSIKKHVLPPSQWKKKHVSKFRSFLKDLYYYVSKAILPVFGNLVFIVEKPNLHSDSDKIISLEERLICPITNTFLVYKDGYFVSTNETGTKYKYPIYHGIPVLIKEDALLYNER